MTNTSDETGSNWHGNVATPDDGTTMHVSPPSLSSFAGEGANERLRESHVNKPGMRRMTSADFSNPYLIQKIRINSTPAQLAFVDGFERCDTALRSLSVVLPVLQKDALAIKAVNDAIAQLFATASQEIRVEQARVQKIAEDNGMGGDPLNYTKAAEYPARITGSKSGLYLQLVRELDKLIGKIHSLWLVGFMADDAMSAAEQQWQRRISSVALDVVKMEARAFQAVFRQKNVIKIVDPSAPAVDAADHNDGDDAVSETVENKPGKKSRKTKAPEAASVITPDTPADQSPS